MIDIPSGISIFYFKYRTNFFGEGVYKMTRQKSMLPYTIKITNYTYNDISIIKDILEFILMDDKLIIEVREDFAKNIDHPFTESQRFHQFLKLDFLISNYSLFKNMTYDEASKLIDLILEVMDPDLREKLKVFIKKDKKSMLKEIDQFIYKINGIVHQTSTTESIKVEVTTDVDVVTRMKKLSNDRALCINIIMHHGQGTTGNVTYNNGEIYEPKLNVYPIRTHKLTEIN